MSSPNSPPTLPGEPRAERPHMPGYGIPDADSDVGLLPWSWAVERLVPSRRYWVATTRPGGAPHLMAVWGVWAGALYFSTGARSRKARNLAADPRCAVSVEDAAEAVVVEGVVEPVTDDEELERAAAAYEAKYGTRPPTTPNDPLLAVRPRVAFGFVDDEARFPATATRWKFPSG